MPAYDLREVLKRCHNYIYGNQGFSKEKSFEELSKVILCKIQDEKDTGPSRFHTPLDGLFEQVKRSAPDLFEDKTTKIELDPRVLGYLVEQLQSYSMSRTDIDLKGAAYEELVASNLRGGRGEFFTPRSVCNLAVGIIDTMLPNHEAKILDPACGTGGFLISALGRLDGEEFAKRNIYGVDINPILSRACKVNLVMHGGRPDNILCFNSLLMPTSFPSKLPEGFRLGAFEVVITNPPFGSKIPVDDPRLLKEYAVGHVWLRTHRGFEMTRRIRNSVPPEQLFVERCLKFLGPGGKLAIVLPDSILSNPGLEFMRYWILQHANVIASIGLPTETFLPFTGTHASLLVLERTKSDFAEVEFGQPEEAYEIFASSPNQIGYDRRGHPLFRRTANGDVIVEEKKYVQRRTIDGREVSEVIIASEPVVADDFPKVLSDFRNWWRSS